VGSPVLRKDRGLSSLTQEKLPMSTDTTVSPLRQRMIEDMAARKLGSQSQRSHISSCKRFAAFLQRSCRRSHSRDFVPWRFSDAWRHRVWIGSSCRRQRNLRTPATQQTHARRTAAWVIAYRDLADQPAALGTLGSLGVPASSVAIKIR